MGLFKKTKAQRVVRLVRTMRKNAENMRMWKNIPLARESVELLRAIDDPKVIEGLRDFIVFDD
jgi:hypothetical protein